MASIRQHHNRWQVLFRDPDGELRAKSFRLKTDAQRYARRVETDKEDGKWVDPRRGRERLEEFWASWLEGAERNAKRGGKPGERTLISYTHLMDRYVLPALGRLSLNVITKAKVRAVVEAAGAVSAYQANDVLKVLRMLLNHAVEDEKITRNPASSIPAPRLPQSEPWVLTPEEVERLAEAVPDRYRALVLVAAYSSLRWSELVALRVDRVDLLRRRLRVEAKIVEYGRLIPGEPKTEKSRRAVSISEDIAFELSEHLRKYPPGDDGLVFTAPEGGVIRRPAFARLVWGRATEAAGLAGFRFANLRHTGASLAIAAGANPMLVAARLGHTSTRMVEKHYVTLFEGLDAEVGERMGAMRGRAAAESRRLRPDVDQVLTKRRRAASKVTSLDEKRAVD